VRNGGEHLRITARERSEMSLKNKLKWQLPSPLALHSISLPRKGNIW
jgi:hypothetical protein